MQYKILLISLIFPFLYSCENELPDAREFPIIRTLDVVEIDSTGATFQGELVKNGTIPITSYGFVWDTKDPNLENSSKAILGDKISSSTFNVRIDSSLVKGLEYNVRTFATYGGNKIIYGNIIKLVSKGSTKSAWSLEIKDIKLERWVASYGCSNNEAGYIIFQNSKVYSFNPGKNEISKSANFPLSGNQFTKFTSVSIGNILYLFSDINRNFFKLQAGSWTLQTSVPVNYGNFVVFNYGFAVSDSIIFLSPYLSFMYQVNSNLWQIKATLPTNLQSGPITGGIYINNKAYVMTLDKNICEYNTNSDTWITKTKYPGNLYEKIISFSFNGKLYFGLSHHDHSENSNWFDRKLWIYNPVLNTWSSTQDFPMDLSFANLFFFSINGKLYIGYENNETYNIWKFDPSKI